MAGKGGRPPKSTAQHKADGTYHATKHRDRLKYPILDAIPKPPTGFTKEQVVKWNIICGTLQRDGMLSDTFLHLVELYCNAWKRWCEGAQEVDKTGITFGTDSGQTKQNPAVAIEKEMMALQLRILQDMGYTPRAAMSMKSTGQEKQDDDPLAFLLNKNKN